MNDLPELPFEKILGYLSLEERLKARAVLRRWYKTISGFKVNSLTYVQLKTGFMTELKMPDKEVIGGLSNNFCIMSSRFESFFQTFGQSTLSNLKRLRLYDICLNAENRSTLAKTLHSFDQLEELALFRFNNLKSKSTPKVEFELNLPALRSIRLEHVYEIKKLTLDAPRLQTLKIGHCPSFLRLNIVYVESVERLFIKRMKLPEVKKLKNLKYFYGYEPMIESTFLTSFEQLNEIHLAWTPRERIVELFEQKQRYGRTDLKIFLFGLLLNGPDDPGMKTYNSFISNNQYYNEPTIDYLAANHARLAEEIPFWDSLYCTEIERVPLDLARPVLNRFTNLNRIDVSTPVDDIQRFLDCLKSFDNLQSLMFDCYQPQSLFDRLPDYCAVQWLNIGTEIFNFSFLFKLKSLVCLIVKCPIAVELIQRVLEELKFVSKVHFKLSGRDIEIEAGYGRPKQGIKVSAGTNVNYIKKKTVDDAAAAIRFIGENLSRKKRTAGTIGSWLNRAR